MGTMVLRDEFLLSGTQLNHVYPRSTYTQWFRSSTLFSTLVSDLHVQLFQCKCKSVSTALSFHTSQYSHNEHDKEHEGCHEHTEDLARREAC